MIAKTMSGWTPQQEQLLVTWAEKASGSAWLHSRSVSYYRHRGYYLAVPACLFSYAAGMTSFGTANNEESSLNYVIGIMGMLSGVFISLQEVFPFKELSAQHRIASLRFLSFFRDVSCELSVDADDRADAVDYINMKRVELDKLHEQIPSVSETIIKKFHEKFGELNIHKPDAVGTLQTIVPYGRNVVFATGSNLVEVANSEVSSLSSDGDGGSFRELECTNL